MFYVSSLAEVWISRLSCSGTSCLCFKKTNSANIDDSFLSSSSSEDEKKTPLKGLKKQKLRDMSSSDSDDEYVRISVMDISMMVT